MPSSLGPQERKQDDLEAAIDAALACCDNDPRAAIASLVIALSLSEEALERTHERVSKGYVRSRRTVPL